MGARWGRIGPRAWVALVVLGAGAVLAPAIVVWLGERTGVHARSESVVPGRAQPGNRLAEAASPYLREAAQQPVHWRPWGDAAFRQARKEDKLILLDIGAVWCHWCHVMDVESYENEEIARVVNQHFVAIKVDRDARPDVDRRYQEAVQALTGRGGWPLTAFLTPDGEVFYGGTYFPPEDRGGRPGLKTLLPKVAEVYRTRRADVLASARGLAKALERSGEEAVQKGRLSEDLVETISANMARQFDRLHGGFGTRPKFPAPSAIEFALARHFVKQDLATLEIAVASLNAMAHGGVYDQIGGGFFRYATDPQWRVPHFEKMNYDNAGLLLNYLHAYQATANPLYRETATGIMAYLDKVLSDRTNGGFYAHQDADMTREDDGDYYTWTVQEVRRALPKDEAEVILRYYDIQPIGEMRENPAKNVPYVATTTDAIAKELEMSHERVSSLLDRGKRRLHHARAQRKTPFVDKTLYIDRNAMLISAYLKAYKVLGNEKAKDFAVMTLDLLLRQAYRPGKGMYHAYADGHARLPGLLNDQVQMAHASLDAFEVTGEDRYVTLARDLMDYTIRELWDPNAGGFFDRHHGDATLAALKRPRKDIYDNPTPSGNGVAALVLDRLASLTNNEGYRRKALHTLEAFAGGAKDYGRAGATYALAVHYHINQQAQAVIIGARDDQRTLVLWKAALTAYRPGKIVAVYDPSDLQLEGLPPAVAGAVKVFGAQGEPRAYVCAGSTCAPPSADPDEVAALVTGYGLEAS